MYRYGLLKYLSSSEPNSLQSCFTLRRYIFAAAKIRDASEPKAKEVSFGPLSGVVCDLAEGDMRGLLLEAVSEVEGEAEGERSRL